MLRPHLNTFLTVCETGSFNKAANALYITPQRCTAADSNAGGRFGGHALYPAKARGHADL